MRRPGKEFPAIFARFRPGRWRGTAARTLGTFPTAKSLERAKETARTGLCRRRLLIPGSGPLVLSQSEDGRRRTEDGIGSRSSRSRLLKPKMPALSDVADVITPRRGNAGYPSARRELGRGGRR